jgi:23S rRNA pseudouridine1911/1915/1917 synthase
LQPEAIPLTIVHQDEHLAVIDKPAGMVTHPGAGKFTGTLVNALLHHMQGSLSGIQGVARPGIVHRLDKDTSGLLVIAKDDQTHRHLAEQIKKKEARRSYIALVEGSLKEDSMTIAKNIGRHPHKRKQMAVVEHGKSAVSRVTVLRRWHKYTLVQVELETGRTHQIRVHMASIGCPVVGDLVYNSKSTGTESARHKLGLNGHALHAFQLSFVHPITAVLLKFEAPLPDDFQHLITKLG